MGIKKTVNSARSGWMGAGAPEGDIVVSSRIRIARNLHGYSFPHLLDREKAEQVIHAVQLALENGELVKQAGILEMNRMAELSPVERQILVEKHLISPNLLEEHEKKAVALRDDELVSIMVNEEDHLRIQCLLPGLQLEKAWEMADKIDDGLEKTLDYAFSSKYGYLTACPTNAGTGLRASVMLHLPGLVLVDQIRGVLASISKLGFTVRGLYGEGTEALGNLFQLSNQVTLGHSEEEIISSLNSITGQLLAREREARKALLQQRREQLADRVGRSYGTLMHAHMMSSEEAMRRISDVRLGVDLQMITGIAPEQLTELMVMTRPAYLLKQAQGDLSPAQRDNMRANIIRSKLNQR
ncbi:protein arginine kinase [Desulfoscipio geothermicus]|uniref:Protein-arginine kinase n=1 Tax=Desulfoscipio geothermicus DSM 3669 TaxID=1121426 RepID=A0A1I6DVB0_9FIRM|nr:protein arginine kinase [Desulfoscipio geothermicus]SFR09375.1 protein arginine kinase [Desulfoscipio geothermicus DSM 3669]